MITTPRSKYIENHEHMEKRPTLSIIYPHQAEYDTLVVPHTFSYISEYESVGNEITFSPTDFQNFF